MYLSSITLRASSRVSFRFSLNHFQPDSGASCLAPAAFTEAYCERNDVETDNVGIVIFQPIASTLAAVTTELALKVGRFSSRFI